MFITSARLQQFRSYTDSSFEFEPNVNIVVGPNASGKTNLLDALYLTATGATMKQAKDFVIQTGQAWARVDVLLSNNQTRTLKINLEQTEIIIDDKPFKRVSIQYSLPVVLFEPNHLYFITTSPDMRRQYVDDILERTDPEFPKIRSGYNRTLRQRNALLKQPLSVVKNQIFAWDVRLCERAGQYVEKRCQLLTQINKKSSDIYSAIAGSAHVLAVEYESKLPTSSYSTSLLKQLQNQLERDHMRGFTGNGPHRDDLSLKIDNKDMRDVASRGETRSILLALKIIEAQVLEQHTQKKPLLLLDDVFGELDGARRKNLIKFMSDYQTFITTTDADVISHDFIKTANIITI